MLKNDNIINFKIPFAVLFNIVRWMQLEILSSKPYPNAIPGIVAYLANDNALNGLCGKTLGTTLNNTYKCAHINVLISPLILVRSFSNFQQI